MSSLLDHYFELERRLVADHGDKVALLGLGLHHYIALGWRLDNNGQWHRLWRMKAVLGLASEACDLSGPAKDWYGDLCRIQIAPKDLDNYRKMLTDDGWVVHCYSLHGVDRDD